MAQRLRLDGKIGGLICPSISVLGSGVLALDISALNPEVVRTIFLGLSDSEELVATRLCGCTATFGRLGVV